MSDTVSPQVTDAVTQTNVKVLAEAPAEAMGVIYQVLAQSVGLTMQNAVSAQQNMTTVAASAIAKSVSMIIDG